MSDKSAIEWTDATWNPTVGCSIVSPGCTNCYAMKVAHGLERRFGSAKYAGLTRVVNGIAIWTGEVRLDEAALLQPLHWKKPRRIFVNSMSDLFHESLPDEAIDKVFAVMALCPQHTFQVLTKRAERMRTYLTAPHVAKRIAVEMAAVLEPTGQSGERPPTKRIEEGSRRAVFAGDPEDGGLFHAVGIEPWPLSNVWLGVSAERQREADERIPHLLETPATVRFVSLEPLLGPIYLTRWLHDSDCNVLEHGVAGTCTCCEPREVSVDWVIVGGESGPRARPMHPEWARSLRDQCATAGVPFFFKQWGEWQPHRVVAGGDLGGDVRAGRVRIAHPTGQSDVEIFTATGRNTISGSRYMARVGKKAAGRLLGGVEHNGFPQVLR